MLLKAKTHKRFLKVVFYGGALLALGWWALAKEPQAQPLNEPAVEVTESIEQKEKNVNKEIESTKPATLVEPQQENRKNVEVSRAVAVRFIVPAQGEVTSLFGVRWGRQHDGVDIANEEGTPIYAAMDGKVTYAGWVSGYGNTVMMEHKYGYATLYGHMKTVLVNDGAIIKSGQVIGKMGSTGNSTGPHVHFEVTKEGVLMNPLTVLPQYMQ